MSLYTSVSITGYNSNPPDDDGSQVSTNEISWSKHKTKLADPVKTAVESINTNVAAGFSSIESSVVPATTATIFLQSAAPTGWTKDTTANLNDTALRLVTGTPSSSTVHSAFSTVFGLTATDAFTLTNTYIPSHSHSNGSLTAASHDHPYTAPDDGACPTGSGASGRKTAQTSGTTGSSGSLNVSGSTSSTGSGTAHSHDIDLRVNYHDVIKATKDAY